MTTSSGLHHVTAMAGTARRNLDFYAQGLGLRFVKKTVNFDDPGTYHFYFGDAVGTPGTIITFFPWGDAASGRMGTGETQETAFAVPAGSLDGWATRLADLGVAPGAIVSRFGERVLPFADPDGMPLALVETGWAAGVPAWDGGPMADDAAIRGFAAVTLGIADPAGTARVLTEVFGWRAAGTEAGRQRFIAPGDETYPGHVVDLVTVGGGRGRLGAGSVHHIAFRAASDAEQAAMAQALARIGVPTTEQKDRNYFRSIYFREPGGVLFEIATDDPGFAIDESVESLGTRLMLPEQYEVARARIEAVLPDLGAAS
jgi:glyoxalase family protein